jgi:hypothetical protein
MGHEISRRSLSALMLLGMAAPFILIWFSISLNTTALFIAVGVIIILGTTLVMSDAQTVKALDEFRAHMRENWRDWTWTERFTMKMGDVPFTICNRILWLETMFMIIIQHQDMFLILFAGFGITIIMIMLRLKHDDSWR